MVKPTQPEQKVRLSDEKMSRLSETDRFILENEYAMKFTEDSKTLYNIGVVDDGNIKGVRGIISPALTGTINKDKLVDIITIEKGCFLG